MRAARKILVLVFIFTLTPLLYAEDEVGDTACPKFEPILGMDIAETPEAKSLPEEETDSFLDFINKKAYASTVDEKEERKILREQWKEMLGGVDIFYSYFKVKEVEDWVSEKTSIEIFNMKGRAKFDNERVIYVFKVKL